MGTACRDRSGPCRSCMDTPDDEVLIVERLREYLFLFGFAGGILAIDQYSKYLVRTNLAFGESWTPIPQVGSLFRIVHWENTGAAFGLFPAGGTLFTVIAIIVSAAILYYFPQIPSDHLALRIALGLQLGGALGNLTDRLLFGPVTDFFAVYSIPVFNIADASISLGVGILLISMWVEERRARKVRDGEGHDDEHQREPAEA